MKTIEIPESHLVSYMIRWTKFGKQHCLIYAPDEMMLAKNAKERNRGQMYAVFDDGTEIELYTNALKNKEKK